MQWKKSPISGQKIQKSDWNFVTDFCKKCDESAVKILVQKPDRKSVINCHILMHKTTLWRCMQWYCAICWIKSFLKLVEKIGFIRSSGRECGRLGISASPSTQCFWAVHSNLNGSTYILSPDPPFLYKPLFTEFYTRMFGDHTSSRNLHGI